MKKLTAGIFATILGVTAMGAADAAVTSKGYVDAAVGVVAGDVSALSQTVSSHATDIAGLKGADTTLQNNINAVADDVDALETGKQNVLQGTMITKVGDGNVVSEITAADGAITYTTASVATSEGLSALTTRVGTAEGEIDALQEKTANLGSAAYTESTAYATAAQGAKADTTAATVATYGDIVTHNVAEFATAAQGAKADTAVQPAAIGDMATKTWVGEQDYATENFVTTQGYLKSADLATYATQEYANTAATTAANGKDAAIAEAKQAGTDAAAAAEAAQGTANDALGKANTNATAITNLQAFDNSIKTATENAADGTYALTMKKNAQTGEMEFGWELIDRDYVETDTTPNGQ